MYSLPIATYTDYWRSAKNRSLYIGSGILLAGTTLIHAPADLVMDHFPKKTASQIQPIDVQAKVSPEPLISTVKEADPGPELSTQLHTEFRIVDVKVPVVTEYVESKLIAPGMNQVKDEGSQGTERRVVKITQVNGEIISEQITHQFLLEAPKKRVVIRNSQPVVAEQQVSREFVDPSKLNVQTILSMEATAYTYTGNRTATGVEPREGIIAVDPRVIPLGTRVYVEDYGYAIAADTGGAIKGKIIDVFFPSLQRCLNWGRRPVQVYVLDGK